MARNGRAGSSPAPGTCFMKQQRYQELVQQFSALTTAEHDPVANMANLAALLRETFQFWWVGFTSYVLKNWCWGHFRDL